MYRHLNQCYGRPLIVRLKTGVLVKFVPRELGEKSGVLTLVGNKLGGGEVLLPTPAIDSLQRNPNNLIWPIVCASLHSDYTPGGNITSSQLVGPPQIDQLWQRHRWEVVGDIDDLAWRVAGSAAHEVLRHADPENALIEERLGISIQGPTGWWEVTSQIDRYGQTHTHIDWKFCSVFSFMLGDKPEWQDKIQVGTHIIQHNTFEVTQSMIVALFRDWSKGKSLYTKGYPRSPWHIQEIPIWEPDRAHAYIEERVALHQLAREAPDENLPPCTTGEGGETWTRDEAYAFKKKGAQKATKLFKVKDFGDSANPAIAAKEAAHAKLLSGSAPDDHCVEHRPGQRVRCEMYCPNAPVCLQWQAHQAGLQAKGETDEDNG